MARRYRRKTAQRSEAERHLRVRMVERDQPDLELLAQIIAEMAIEDPLNLASHPDKETPPEAA